MFLSAFTRKTALETIVTSQRRVYQRRNLAGVPGHENWLPIRLSFLMNSGLPEY